MANVRLDRSASTRFRQLAVGLGVLLLALPAGAADPQPVKREVPRVLDAWVAQLRSIDGHLKAAEWKKAKRSCDFLLDEMRRRIEGGPGAGGLLALASLYRALAEAGLGDEHNAAWDFRIAQALYPAYFEVDLSAYSAAAIVLDRHRLGPRGESSPAPGAERDQPLPVMRGILPPKRLHMTRPSFPFAKFQACVTGEVVVLTVIGRDGRVRDPSLVSAGDPVLAFAAMDALRDWEFEPARLEANGEPTVVFYTLTVNYKLPLCTNPFARAERAD